MLIHGIIMGYTREREGEAVGRELAKSVERGTDEGGRVSS